MEKKARDTLAKALWKIEARPTSKGGQSYESVRKEYLKKSNALIRMLERRGVDLSVSTPE